MKPRSVVIILFACLLLALGMGFATRTQARGSASSPATLTPVDEAWRAHLPKDPQAATEAYLARLSPEATARSNAYFRGGYWLQLWNLLVTVGSGLLLLASGASAALRTFVERRTRRKPLQTLLFTVLILGAVTLLALPLSTFAGFMREHWYGMSTQRFGPWLVEQVVAFLVSAVMMGLLAVPLYALLRRCPRTWWVWGMGLSLAFLAFTILIGPVAVDPLFNTYKPLAAGPVREEILSMARANGVPVKDVHQFDASRQTNRVSANVSGMLGTAAVRLNDNLLNRCSLPEIKAVMAHELGHYVLNHTYKLLAFLTFILAGGFAFVHWGTGWTLARWGEAWGLRGFGDLAGMPLLMILFSLFFFLATPATNTVIRAHEVEADFFSLNASREPDGFADAQMLLTEYRNPNPGPVEEFIFCDHPSPRNRIYSAMRWKAEHPGK